MADYFSPTVIQQPIPVADMTPLECLVLSLVFDAECEGDALTFYSETGPSDGIGLSIAELRAACDASAGIDSVIGVHVQACLADADPEATEIELDLSTVSWERLLQDIVRRSPTLDHVTVVAAFTCTKMRADGFGGMAMLITADATHSKSTHDILAEFLVARARQGRCLTMRVSYGTYLRLDITVHDGWRAVVRAAARTLSQKVRRDVARRADRHRYDRQMLDDHREAQAIVSYWCL